jgi:phenylacetate-CoA ligase
MVDLNGPLSNYYYDRRLETIAPHARAELLGRRLSAFVDAVYHGDTAARARFEKAKVSPAAVKSVQDLERLPIVWQRESDLFRVSQERHHGTRSRKVIPTDRRWEQAMVAAGIRKDVTLLSLDRRQAALAHELDAALTNLEAIPVPALTNDLGFQARMLEKLQVSAFVGTRDRLALLLDHAGFDPTITNSGFFLETVLLVDAQGKSNRDSSLENYGRLIVRRGLGNAELGCLGFECFHENGYHTPENMIVEVVDPVTERPVEHGKWGSLVLTIFDPDQPVLRAGWMIDVVLEDDECPCGRTSPRLTFA